MPQQQLQHLLLAVTLPMQWCLSFLMSLVTYVISYYRAEWNAYAV